MQDVVVTAQPFIFLLGPPGPFTASSSGGGGGLTGIGSPEGVVTASPGTTYLDTSTNSFWDKATGTGSVGWVQLIA